MAAAFGSQNSVDVNQMDTSPVVYEENSFTT